MTLKLFYQVLLTLSLCSLSLQQCTSLFGSSNTNIDSASPLIASGRDFQSQNSLNVLDLLGLNICLQINQPSFLRLDPLSNFQNFDQNVMKALRVEMRFTGLGLSSANFRMWTADRKVMSDYVGDNSCGIISLGCTIERTYLLNTSATYYFEVMPTTLALDFGIKIYYVSPCESDVLSPFTLPLLSTSRILNNVTRRVVTSQVVSETLTRKITQNKIQEKRQYRVPICGYNKFKFLLPLIDIFNKVDTVIPPLETLLASSVHRFNVTAATVSIHEEKSNSITFVSELLNSVGSLIDETSGSTTQLQLGSILNTEKNFLLNVIPQIEFLLSPVFYIIDLELNILEIVEDIVEIFPPYCALDIAPFTCYNGPCAISPSKCQVQNCTLPLISCWNGQCISPERFSEECPTLPSCPLIAPQRCPTGECIASTAQCPTSTCENSNSFLCTGLLPFNGCPLEQPIKCPEGTCVTDLSFCYCPATSSFRCFDGECVTDPLQCKAAPYSQKLLEVNVAIHSDATQDMVVPLLTKDRLSQPCLLTIPSGFLETYFNRTSTTQAILNVKEIPDSELRAIEPFDVFQFFSAVFNLTINGESKVSFDKPISLSCNITVPPKYEDARPCLSIVVQNDTSKAWKCEHFTTSISTGIGKRDFFFDAVIGTTNETGSYGVLFGDKSSNEDVKQDPKEAKKGLPFMYIATFTAAIIAVIIGFIAAALVYKKKRDRHDKSLERIQRMMEDGGTPPSGSTPETTSSAYPTSKSRTISVTSLIDAFRIRSRSASK